MSELITRLPKVRGVYRANANLSKTNWFQVGGDAEILFRPKDIDDLCFFLKNISKDIPLTILGVGSNVIIRDGGIAGVVIKLSGEFAKITHQDDIISVGAAALCFNVANYAKDFGLANLEFLTGIPGSIGGAIAMNAGCYGGDISQTLISATAIDYNGNLVKLQNSDCNFSYRSNKIAKNYIFVSGDFKTQKSSQEEIAAKIANYNQNRQETQPIKSKTGGSTFKNPTNSDKKAWQLIDEAGCRGLAIGDAQMSEKHCNFMINNGNATANQLIELGQKVQKMVKEKTSIELEWEIKILGSDTLLS
jgi:UDP-N-acetylmuramate dehydrogenase